MVQLIDKSAVVAEIERIKKEECPTDSYEGRCKLLWFEQFLSFINTLETKDVNLEEEINNFLNEEYRYTEYEGKWVDEKDWRDSIQRCARHFYELGLKAQKGE